MLTTISALAILQAASTTAATTPPAPPPPARPRCNTEEYAAFDLWVGEWEVYPNGQDRKVADSNIERLYNGCAVRENWMPLSGGGGGSLNAYNPMTGLWHQTWIGSSPGDIEFKGGPVDGKMVLNGYWPGSAGPGSNPLQRITYSRNEDGSVRQHGEGSTDHGLTWTTNFDLIYRPKQQETE